MFARAPISFTTASLGGEITIPSLHAMIATAAAGGVVEVAIGMPHRGRLNTLVNIVKKPLTALFSEFGGESFKPDDVQGAGDVKYHLGTSTDIGSAGHNVQRARHRVTVHAQLFDARVCTRLWAQTYERDVSDEFAIQTEIARAIAGQLQAKISLSEKAAIAQAPTGDLVANALYQQALAIEDPEYHKSWLQGQHAQFNPPTS